MKYRNNPPYRSFAEPLGGQGESPFPGISDPFFGGGLHTPLPFNGPPFESGTPSILLQPPADSISASAQVIESTTTSGGKGSFNIAELKGMVDRLGGIDGIVNTMQKVQKIVGSIQQMAPLIKVLAGSFGKKKTAGKFADGAAAPAQRRRRKRRRTGSVSPKVQVKRRRARTRKR